MAKQLIGTADITDDLGTNAVRWRKVIAQALSDGTDSIDIADIISGLALTNFAGWGNYTSDEVLDQVIGTTASKLVINALGANTNSDYLPAEIQGTGQLWDGATSKITPITLGDGYTLRLDLQILEEGANPSELIVDLDIGGAATPTNVIVSTIVPLGSSVPHTVSPSFPIFTLATFLANGGQFFLRTDAGTATLRKRQISIHRISKGS